MIKEYTSILSLFNYFDALNPDDKIRVSSKIPEFVKIIKGHRPNLTQVYIALPTDPFSISLTKAFQLNGISVVPIERVSMEIDRHEHDTFRYEYAIILNWMRNNHPTNQENIKRVSFSDNDSYSLKNTIRHINLISENVIKGENIISEDTVNFFIETYFPYTIKSRYMVQSALADLFKDEFHAVSLSYCPILTLYMEFMEHTSKRNAFHEDKEKLVEKIVQSFKLIDDKTSTDSFEKLMGFYISSHHKFVHMKLTGTDDINGTDKSKPVMNKNNRIIIGNVSEDEVKSHLDGIIYMDNDMLSEMIGKPVSQNIPEKVKFAVFHDFPMNAFTIMSESGEQVLVKEEKTNEIFLLYMENDTELKGISMTDTGKKYKNFIYFEDLDTDSEYEIVSRE